MQDYSRWSESRNNQAIGREAKISRLIKLQSRSTHKAKIWVVSLQTHIHNQCQESTQSSFQLENHRVVAHTRHRNSSNHSLEERWSLIHRRLMRQCTAGQKGQTVTSARISAKTIRRYLMITRAILRWIHRDYKVPQAINGHIQETDVLRSHVQLFKSHFQPFQTNQTGKIMRHHRRMRRHLPQEKTENHRQMEQTQQVLRQKALHPSQTFIMSLQSFPSQPKVESQLTTHIKLTRIHI